MNKRSVAASVWRITREQLAAAFKARRFDSPFLKMPISWQADYVFSDLCSKIGNENLRLRGASHIFN
jgi:transposase